MLLRKQSTPVMGYRYRLAMESLSKHFRVITRAAFARHGFAQADVVSNWNEIVGEELAAISSPERIRWPRGAGEEARKSGGTLIIRAAPGRALDLQYDASRITGRINSFFGYGAVTAIKVVQASGWLPQRPAAALSGTPKPLDNHGLEAIEDGQLKAALERLGQSIAQGTASAPRSSPQDK
jgi:hypothetical protein